MHDDRVTCKTHNHLNRFDTGLKRLLVFTQAKPDPTTLMFADLDKYY